MNDKIYRPAVLVLLAVVAAALIAPQLSGPSEECIAAREAAGSIAEIRTEMNALETYEDVVYGQAENINQQIFYTGEFQVVGLEILATQMSALMAVVSACQ